MKRVMKVLGIVILVAAVVVAVLVVKGYIQSKKPSVREDYYADFSSPCPLEQKYSQPGGYAVSSVCPIGQRIPRGFAIDGRCLDGCLGQA